jgi:hypothetical protein
MTLSHGMDEGNDVMMLLQMLRKGWFSRAAVSG